MEYLQQNKDPELWQLAQRRASFKPHLFIYLTLSVFFWLLWYFTGNTYYESDFPWPVWPMLGWGIGVAFHYIGAYVAPKSNTAQKEYEKLLQQHHTNTNI